MLYIYSMQISLGGVAMRLEFIGADHEVTGSCHYIEACGKHILVDYGMEQGINVFENVPLPVSEAMIDYVFLTHAHVDHSGLLPLLYARGFRGRVYATEASTQLSSIMLRDIEVWLEENGVKKKLVFSGDIGNKSQPLIKDPAYTDEADYVVMESTYGDRLHSAQRVDYVSELAGIISKTLKRGGNVVIPSFAVGRTQEILYFIRQIKAQQLIKDIPDFPVYVDSPMAVEATAVFVDNKDECYDAEATELVKSGINPLTFKNLHLSITSEESKAINFDTTPKVIISASGMCDAGRIRHHLKHNLWRPESTVLFVGYQSVGTLGRAIVEGADEVKLFGETIEVRAEILTLNGLSGHADKNGLIEWISAFEKKPDRVFVVHGDDATATAFTECLKIEHGQKAYAPYSGTIVNLADGSFEYEAVPVPVEKKTKPASGIYARLLAAAQRLLAIVKKSDGLANKDMGRFADQIISICDKWDTEDK